MELKRLLFLAGLDSSGHRLTQLDESMFNSVNEAKDESDDKCEKCDCDPCECKDDKSDDKDDDKSDDKDDKKDDDKSDDKDDDTKEEQEEVKECASGCDPAKCKCDADCKCGCNKVVEGVVLGLRGAERYDFGTIGRIRFLAGLDDEKIETARNTVDSDKE